MIAQISPSWNSYLSTLVIGADWFDHRGQPIETCTLDEADQIVKQVIRNLREEATSKETFLINLSALAGGEFLRTPWNHLKMTRLEGDEKLQDIYCQVGIEIRCR